MPHARSLTMCQAGQCENDDTNLPMQSDFHGPALRRQVWNDIQEDSKLPMSTGPKTVRITFSRRPVGHHRSWPGEHVRHIRCKLLVTCRNFCIIELPLLQVSSMCFFLGTWRTHEISIRCLSGTVSYSSRKVLESRSVPQVSRARNMNKSTLEACRQNGRRRMEGCAILSTVFRFCASDSSFSWWHIYRLTPLKAASSKLGHSRDFGSF